MLSLGCVTKYRGINMNKSCVFFVVGLVLGCLVSIAQADCTGFDNNCFGGCWRSGFRPTGPVECTLRVMGNTDYDVPIVWGDISFIAPQNECVTVSRSMFADNSGFVYLPELASDVQGMDFSCKDTLSIEGISMYGIGVFFGTAVVGLLLWAGLG